MEQIHIDQQTLTFVYLFDMDPIAFALGLVHYYKCEFKININTKLGKEYNRFCNCKHFSLTSVLQLTVMMGFSA
jgi:hypothetical protein